MEPGIRYLLEASVKLTCSRDTTIRAMVLYHNFMRCVDEVKYDDAMVAAAALNLSSKIGEEFIDLDATVLLFYCIVWKTDKVLDSDDPSFILLKKSSVTVNFIMHRMLEFTWNHQLAHQYLMPFLEAVFARSKKISCHHRALSDTCLSLANDFYASKKCLYYKPEHIAVSCVDIAIHFFKLEKNLEVLDPWYEGLCKDLTPEKLKDIEYNVCLVYKEQKGNVAQTKVTGAEEPMCCDEVVPLPKAPVSSPVCYNKDVPQPAVPQEHPPVYCIEDAPQPKVPNVQVDVPQPKAPSIPVYSKEGAPQPRAPTVQPMAADAVPTKALSGQQPVYTKESTPQPKIPMAQPMAADVVQPKVPSGQQPVYNKESTPQPKIPMAQPIAADVVRPKVPTGQQSGFSKEGAPQPKAPIVPPTTAVAVPPKSLSGPGVSKKDAPLAAAPIEQELTKAVDSDDVVIELEKDITVKKVPKVIAEITLD